MQGSRIDMGVIQRIRTISQNSNKSEMSDNRANLVAKRVVAEGAQATDDQPPDGRVSATFGLEERKNDRRKSDNSSILGGS